jgi:hypothetical protein
VFKFVSKNAPPPGIPHAVAALVTVSPQSPSNSNGGVVTFSDWDNTTCTGTATFTGQSSVVVYTYNDPANPYQWKANDAITGQFNTTYTITSANNGSVVTLTPLPADATSNPTSSFVDGLLPGFFIRLEKQ